MNNFRTIDRQTGFLLLLDYFGANNTPIRAFDTESPRGTLKRFHPEATKVVDVTTVRDQMKIFDTLAMPKPR